MGILEISLELTDEQRAIQGAAHKFSAEVLRPASVRLSAPDRRRRRLCLLE